MATVINKINFPVGTRILGKYVDGPDYSIRELLCCEWSPAGRCKIFDIAEDRTSWTDIVQYATIEEVLPHRGN